MLQAATSITKCLQKPLIHSDPNRLECVTQMTYRARFDQNKAPTLHRATCPKAQFVDPQPKQKTGLHKSGDALRDLDVVTSGKAYQVLDAEFPGKVRVCSCAEGSTLELVRPKAARRMTRAT
jgi:hypothetical protein